MAEQCGRGADFSPLQDQRQLRARAKNCRESQERLPIGQALANFGQGARSSDKRAFGGVGEAVEHPRSQDLQLEHPGRSTPS